MTLLMKIGQIYRDPVTCSNVLGPWLRAAWVSTLNCGKKTEMHLHVLSWSCTLPGAILEAACGVTAMPGDTKSVSQLERSSNLFSIMSLDLGQRGVSVELCELRR